MDLCEVKVRHLKECYAVLTSCTHEMTSTYCRFPSDVSADHKQTIIQYPVS